jgi:hypothetical protein
MKKGQPPMIGRLVDDFRPPGQKERRPFPEEKMILLRKAQTLIVFEACNLCLDSFELTLKPKEVSTWARQTLLLSVLH